MRLDTRLSKLMPTLSARERAVLWLRARNSGQDPGELRSTMPQEQRPEYNRYMGPAFVCDCQMGALVHVIKNQVENLEFDLRRIAMLEQAATLLEEDHPDEVLQRTVRPWRRERKAGREVTVSFFLRSLAAELRDDAYEELSVRWRELRAVEVVAEEIAESFDGEGALHPDVRGWLASCREQAQTYLQQLGKKRLPEPGDDHVQRAQQLVDRGMAAMSLTEE